MGAKEIIEILKNAPELGFEVIADALVKQVPVDPIFKKGYTKGFKECEDSGESGYFESQWNEWTCPGCGGFVGEQVMLRSRGYGHNQGMCEYCPSCGQRISWDKAKNDEREKRLRAFHEEIESIRDKEKKERKETPKE